MRKAQDTAPAAAQAEKAKESKYGKTKGGQDVTGIAMQLNGRFGPGLDLIFRRLAGYKRAITTAQRGETVDGSYRNGENS